jgi:type IV secretory pathway VirB3-like protein
VINENITLDAENQKFVDDARHAFQVLGEGADLILLRQDSKEISDYKLLQHFKKPPRVMLINYKAFLMMAGFCGLIFIVTANFMAILILPLVLWVPAFIYSNKEEQKILAKLDEKYGVIRQLPQSQQVKP